MCSQGEDSADDGFEEDQESEEPEDVIYKIGKRKILLLLPVFKFAKKYSLPSFHCILVYPWNTLYTLFFNNILKVCLKCISV